MRRCKRNGGSSSSTNTSSSLSFGDTSNTCSRLHQQARRVRAVRLTPQALKRTTARASAAAYPRPMPQHEADKYKAFGHGTMSEDEDEIMIIEEDSTTTARCKLLDKLANRQ